MRGRGSTYTRRREGKGKTTVRSSSSSRRYTGVIDLRRHAARTATVVERATAHVHSHVCGCRSVARAVLE